MAIRRAFRRAALGSVVAVVGRTVVVDATGCAPVPPAGAESPFATARLLARSIGSREVAATQARPLSAPAAPWLALPRSPRLPWETDASLHAAGLGIAPGGPRAAAVRARWLGMPSRRVARACGARRQSTAGCKSGARDRSARTTRTAWSRLDSSRPQGGGQTSRC